MESDILVARISDTYDIAQKTGKPKFFGFLSREQAALAEKTLKNHNADFLLYGGYSEAERVMLCCLPDWCNEADFPICAVTFKYRNEDRLSHRDFLGSLMALGITRESVGDILVETGRAVVFLKEEICGFVISGTQKIGRVGVVAENGYKSPLPQTDKLITATATVSSLRLDCVVGALIGASRSKVGEMIEAGLVTVNSLVCDKLTKQVTEGDTVSVRSKGKFIIIDTNGKTRKDKIILEFKKYF